MLINSRSPIESIPSPLGRHDDSATPRSIFGSRLKLWNDWSDRSTLYQDSAFSTPVAALNDPIGGVLDKSRGLALGSELVTNGDFSSGTDWTPGTGWTISGGVASFSNPTGSSLAQTGLPAMPAGCWYQVEFDLVQTSGSGCTMGLNVGGGIDSFGSFSGTGHKKAVVLTTVSRSGISITGIGNSVISIDNVTLKELSGNHAFQATSASRPLWKQDVNGCFNALFDGTDDSWATAAIDFSASDKIAVFAAVRKLSDPGRAMLVECGTGSENGTFGIEAPFAASATYGFYSRGTAQIRLSSAASYAAPITNVLTLLGNISAPSVTLRVNGVQDTTSGSSQGTGNYGNLPVNIGRRAGASLPVNLALYQLFIVQGAVTAAEIAAAEAYLNSKSKAY